MAILQSGITKSLVADAYDIDNSCRFDRVKESRLIRTPAVAGNLRSWTISVWVKRCEVQGDSPKIYDTGTGYLNFQYTGGFWLGEAGSTNLNPTGVYRDPSAWYHLVVVWDSDNETEANRDRKSVV